jgi:hypothetical protein
MMAANGLHKINLTLLRKDLLYLCGALKHFPTEGYDGDRFAGGDNPDRERRQVFNDAKLQTERLLKTLEGVEYADCEPVEKEILIDLQARLSHLFKIELRQRKGEAVTSRLWSHGPLPQLTPGTLPTLNGVLQTIGQFLYVPGAAGSGKTKLQPLTGPHRRKLQEQSLMRLVRF